jgi:hypothetical protein
MTRTAMPGAGVARGGELGHQVQEAPGLAGSLVR